MPGCANIISQNWEYTHTSRHFSIKINVGYSDTYEFGANNIFKSCFLIIPYLYEILLGNVVKFNKIHIISINLIGVDKNDL